MDVSKGDKHNLLKPLVSGKRIYLREVRLADVTDAYCRWMNDPEINRFMETRFFNQSREAIESYVMETAADPDSVFLAIVV